MPLLTLALVLLFAATSPAVAHGIGGQDAAFVAETHGAALGPFLYLGAKHMVTGLDHLLFLFGVIFFLHRARDVLVYVTLFSAGHSLTLLAGVLLNFGLNASLVDAAIGLSVAYKAFDNLDGFALAGWARPSPRAMVFGFGLIHGLGLATKLLALSPHENGLVANLVAFNIGVELGQALALLIVLVPLWWWRTRPGYRASVTATNWLLMVAGMCLIALHLADYFHASGALS